MSKFSESADYKSVLKRFKTDFDKKWVLNNPSSSDKLGEYENVCVLGSGAFGIVVSFFIN